MYPAVRFEQALLRFKSETPGWGGTSVDSALMTALDLLEEATVGDSEEASRKTKELFLVTDLQEGSSVSGLRSFDWPEEVQLSLTPIETEEKGNAGLHVTTMGGDEKHEVRLLVVNSIDNKKERFIVSWMDDAGNPRGEKKDTYVPPGQSRVVRLKIAGFEAGGKLGLIGDETTFDNTTFHAPRPIVKRNVLVLTGGPPNPVQNFRGCLCPGPCLS